MTIIHLSMDFNIPEKLIEIYAQSTHDRNLGYTEPLNLVMAEKKLEQYSRTQMYASFKRLAICKIWKDGELVGYCLPRKIADSERRGFLIEDELDWYRLGTIYISPEYRGQGIVEEVVKQFRNKYPNLVWKCFFLNLASAGVAKKAGLLYSHIVYHSNDNKSWSFDSTEECCFDYLVFRTPSTEGVEIEIDIQEPIQYINKLK